MHLRDQSQRQYHELPPPAGDYAEALRVCWRMCVPSSSDLPLHRGEQLPGSFVLICCDPSQHRSQRMDFHQKRPGQLLCGVRAFPKPFTGFSTWRDSVPSTGASKHVGCTWGRRLCESLDLGNDRASELIMPLFRILYPDQRSEPGWSIWGSRITAMASATLQHLPRISKLNHIRIYTQRISNAPLFPSASFATAP
jgi:hypothetical protein